MKTISKISFALIIFSVVTFSSCSNFKYDECDCVVLTKNALKHKNDHDWFIGLDKYCKSKGLDGSNKFKWNKKVKECRSK